MHENEISKHIIGAAVEVHRTLGPGLLESAYETALEHELQRQGLGVQRQLGLPMVYKDVRCEVGYRIDLLVQGKVIVEVKSVAALNDVHFAQVLTYLRLSGHRLGLIINFNGLKVTAGVRRVVNQLVE